jgi:hypothetical protein
MNFLKHKKLYWIFFVVIGCIIIPLSDAMALRVIPQRLVLDTDVKVEYMFVKNNSDKTETYRFGWKHMAMDKEGNVLNLDRLGMDKAPAGYKPVDDLVRFSPRRAILKPGQTQRITFMINRGKALADGEYRSHFLFQREPENGDKPKEEVTQQSNNPEASRSRVSFNVLVSRAVPIYVLNGNTSAKLEFVSASVKKNANKKDPKQPDYLAHFKVRKEGNRSVIGIAEVMCMSGGEEVLISKPAKVFAVYAEGEFRDEQMAVELPPKGCSSYKLHIKAHPDDIKAGETLINQVF